MWVIVKTRDRQLFHSSQRMSGQSAGAVTGSQNDLIDVTAIKQRAHVVFNHLRDSAPFVVTMQNDDLQETHRVSNTIFNTLFQFLREFSG